MTYEQFTFWLRGYLASQTDSQMKIDIEKALNQTGVSKVDPRLVSSPSTIPVSPSTIPPYWYSTTGCNETSLSQGKKEVLND